MTGEWFGDDITLQSEINIKGLGDGFQDDEQWRVQ